MKRINKIITILLLGAAAVGCKKNFLDRPSTTLISSENFYQTQADLRLATANLYGGAPWWQWQQPWLLLGDVLPGTAYFGYNNDIEQLYSRTITSQNGVVLSGWTGLYNVIGQCNMVISAISQSTSASLTPTIRNQAIAEARFIRAMAYYHLAVYWGAVPIVTDNTKLVSNALLNRNTVSDVYKFITIDLTFAAQNLPAKDAAGRVTTWSAQGLLGKVYLTMSGWAKMALATRHCWTVPRSMRGMYVRIAGYHCFQAIMTFSRYKTIITPKIYFRLNGPLVWVTAMATF